MVVRSPYPPARRQPVEILSRDYWSKVVGNLEINYCLIDDDLATGHTVAYFMHELSGVFDRMVFSSRPEAEAALRWNGFYRETEESDRPAWGPPPPFWEDRHPNGLIYSSGQFWRTPPAQ